MRYKKKWFCTYWKSFVWTIMPNIRKVKVTIVQNCWLIKTISNNHSIYYKFIQGGFLQFLNSTVPTIILQKSEIWWPLKKLTQKPKIVGFKIYKGKNHKYWVPALFWGPPNSHSIQLLLAIVKDRHKERYLGLLIMQKMHNYWCS